MHISVNGELREVPDNITIAQLLTELKLNPRFLAVERNQELVSRTEHAKCILQDGDSIEIVTLVGGG